MQGFVWVSTEVGGGGVSYLFVDGRIWELRIDCEEGVDGGGLGDF